MKELLIGTEEDKEMQTFLPYADFYKSIQCLSDYRLQRQSFEAGVVLDHVVGRYASTLWKRHRVTRMWRGYESALGLYFSLTLLECAVRGFRSMRVAPYDYRSGYTTKTLHYACTEFLPIDQIVYPPWLGDEEFHASHRSALLRRCPDMRESMGWTEPDDLEQIWPNSKEEPDGYVDHDPKPRSFELLKQVYPAPRP
jgi:hypothetical protein